MSDALVIATLGIVIATLVSPFFAVQAQRWIEEAKEKKRRKMWIFETLMTTRASRTTPNHVMALNAIELTFKEGSKKEGSVVNAWRVYFDHLHNSPDEKIDPETYKQKIEVWGQKNDDLFVDLLSCIADVLDFKFDKVQLKRGIYYPKAQSELEMELNLLRRGILELLAGNASIPMKVIDFPFSQEAYDLQQSVNKAFLKSLSDGSLQVVVNSATGKKLDN
jgi:hypothetical protein